MSASRRWTRCTCSRATRSTSPWVVILAMAHDPERLREVPSDETNGVGVSDVGRQYARGTQASYALANWIRRQGYRATPYPGPSADALLLIPPAIAAGLGELGKHGSMISRRFGAGFRLAGVTTDMPLQPTPADRFGADEFCATCQACTRACPPGAIADHKQMVRGAERWYVDFDKCIPYFAEAASCGICIARLSLDTAGCAAEVAGYDGSTIGSTLSAW